MGSHRARTSSQSTYSYCYRTRFGHNVGHFPVPERIAQTTLALPFFSDMTEQQVDYVCERRVRGIMAQGTLPGRLGKASVLGISRPDAQRT